jgi:hypothetical protein
LVAAPVVVAVEVRVVALAFSFLGQEVLLV